MWFGYPCEVRENLRENNKSLIEIIESSRSKKLVITWILNNNAKNLISWLHSFDTTTKWKLHLTG